MVFSVFYARKFYWLWLCIKTQIKTRVSWIILKFTLKMYEKSLSKTSFKKVTRCAMTKGFLIQIVIHLKGHLLSRRYKHTIRLNMDKLWEIMSSSHCLNRQRELWHHKQNRDYNPSNYWH